MNEQNNEKKNKNYPTSIMLFLRVFIGGYLMYLAYQIYTAGDSSMNKAVSLAFCAVFIIAGIALIILSLKMMIRGEYQGGNADYDEEEKTKSETE